MNETATTDERLHESNRLAHEVARAACQYRRLMNETGRKYSEAAYRKRVHAQRRLESALTAYEKHNEGSE